jgi:hypothetical protein
MGIIESSDITNSQAELTQEQLKQEQLKQEINNNKELIQSKLQN